MKTYITILLLLCSISVYSQTTIEELSNSICENVCSCIKALPNDVSEKEMEACFEDIDKQVAHLSLKEQRELINSFSEKCSHKMEELIKQKEIKTEQSSVKDKSAPKPTCSNFVSVDPTITNVFYEGIDNPLDVMLVNVDKDSVKIEVSQGDFLYSGSRHATIRNLEEGMVQFSFYRRNKLTGSLGYRVKKLPEPSFAIADIDGYKLTKEQLVSAKKIENAAEAFDFYVVPKVKAFNLKIMRAGKIIMDNNNNGALISDENRQLLEKAKQGDVILLESIEYDYVWSPDTKQERFIKNGVSEMMYYVSD